MNSKNPVLKLMLMLLFSAASNAYAQDYTVDYTFDRSGNSRVTQGRKYGLIDSNRKLIIPLIYDEIDDFSSGYARVVLAQKTGFVNKKGEPAIPCIYDTDEQGITGAVTSYVMNNETKITTIMVGSVGERRGFSEGLVCMVQNGKYGFIDKNNKTVIPFQFDGADNFYDSIAIVKQKDKYGAIDRNGRIVIPVIYELLVWDFSSNITALYTHKNGKVIYIDKDQNEIKER